MLPLGCQTVTPVQPRSKPELTGFDPFPPQLVRIIQSGIGGWDRLCHELSWHAAKSLQSDINACVFCVCKLRCVFLTRHVKLLVYPCKCLTFRWSLRHVAQPPKSPSEPLQFVWSLPGAQAWTVYSLPRTARAWTPWDIFLGSHKVRLPWFHMWPWPARSAICHERLGNPWWQASHLCRML